MTKTTLIALVSFFTVTLFASTSQAQVPCGGIIGIGPFGIGIAIDCPPPVIMIRRPVVRRVYRPRPRVIVIDNSCGHRNCSRANSCTRPPRRRPRRPRPQVRPPAPIAPPASVVSAPMYLDGRRVVRRGSKLSIGLFVDSSSYEDGGLLGTGITTRYMLTNNLGIEASISSLSSCTNCNEFASRVDNRLGLGGVWYLGRRRSKGINLFVKGGFVVNSITFSNEVSNESMTMSKTNMEIGGGIELKLTSRFGIFAETSGMFSAEDSDEDGGGTAPLHGNISNGIPSASNSNSALNFKVGLSYHF
jgi:hypothetical protein